HRRARGLSRGLVSRREAVPQTAPGPGSCGSRRHSATELRPAGSQRRALTTRLIKESISNLQRQMGETDMGRLAGKIALISGASRGQGAAEARLFAAEGAAVVLTDVLDQEGEALATALRNEGANAVFRHLDVTSAQEWQGAIDYVR